LCSARHVSGAGALLVAAGSATTKSAAALALVALVDASSLTAAPDGGYYEETPLFIPCPEPGKTWTIRNYGPVGFGLDLISPAFTMRINNVEEGSPAEATGKLKKGQIIESINGRTLEDIDPRVLLADILGEAEATDGTGDNCRSRVTVHLPTRLCYWW